MTLAEVYKLIKHGNELLERGKLISLGDTSCVLSESKKKETPQPVDNREVIQHENGIKYRKPKVAKVYPDAARDAMLTNAEKNALETSVLYPEDMVFFVCDRSKDPRFAELSHGEFYIDGFVLRKEIKKHGLNQSTAIEYIKNEIDKRYCVIKERNKRSGVPAYKIYTYNPLRKGTGKYGKVFVDLSGNFANRVVSCHFCTSKREVERVKNEVIAAGCSFPE